jgi:FKBP-type peptidyl-prolyl cis-trans isomerase
MRNLILAAIVCAACAPAVPNIATTTFDPSLGVDLTQSTLLTNGEYIRDLALGDENDIAPGQVLSVYYSLFTTDGTLIQTNEGDAVFQFTLGAGQVIAGWDQGFGGMKAGGTRQLIIPPALGYGDNSVGGLPPESILVFKVSVVAAQ